MSMNWVAVLLACMTISSAMAAEPDTALTQVPGPLEATGEQFKDYNGFVWYRSYVMPPDRWADYTEGEKNLYAESVRLRLAGITDPYEVYFNGQKIDGAGAMPPKFVAPQPATRIHKFPAGLVR